jgi:hypothetical protein
MPQVTSVAPDFRANAVVRIPVNIDHPIQLR